MYLEKGQKEKLTRYLFNANPFLWGILNTSNKKDRLKEIKDLGFLKDYSENRKPKYQEVVEDLLIELGIEGILEKIVAVKVKQLFGEDILKTFRRHWEHGRIPDKEYLKERKLYRTRHLVLDTNREDERIRYDYPADIFIEINLQFDYCERWTVFAGLWFEEIEPILL